MTPFVLLAESTARYARLLSSLLHQRGFRFASASTLNEARSLATVETPAVLLLDMDSPTREAVRLLTDLRTRGVLAPVLWVSSHVGESEIERVRSSGAQGLLLKDADGETTLQAIRSVAEGGTFFEEEQPTRKASGIRALSMDERLVKLLQG